MSFLSTYHKATMGLLLGAMLAGCPGGGNNNDNKGTVKGQVTDDNGAQARSLLAGQGTVAAAATAQLCTVADDGSLTVVGSAAVQADGSYSIESDTVGETKMIVQIIDANSAVVGSVILDQGLTADETATASPVTSETSVEAEVFVRIAASAEATVDDIDTCDLKARIDASLAVAVATSADIEGDLDAVAQATASAQAAFFAELGTTAQTTFNASLQAAISLSSSLDAAATNAAQSETAYQAYLEDLIFVYAGQGFDEAEQADAQTTASISFQLTANAQASATVAEQATLQAQAYQALTLGIAASATLEAAAAADAAIDAAAAAGTQLSAQLSEAANTSASANAYASFEASIVSGNSSVLSVATGADFEGAIALQQAAIDTAFATFDAALNAASTASAEATAQAVVAAYAALDASVSAAVSTALVLSGQATADASASIFVSTEASFLFNSQQ
jgi:hypothetical protein